MLSANCQPLQGVHNQCLKLYKTTTTRTTNVSSCTKQQRQEQPGLQQRASLYAGGDHAGHRNRGWLLCPRIGTNCDYRRRRERANCFRSRRNGERTGGICTVARYRKRATTAGRVAGSVGEGG